ncbi:MAG: glycosyltransferase family 39 protein [Chloroflexota bacterium]
MGKLASRADIRVPLALAAVLVAAGALRLFLLAGPQTELEADEAIVGLMGRHILQGERPIFYYMQPYMGGLEAYLAAGFFALMGSSTFALKLVPLASALLFVGLVFATGYRLGGLAAAIMSGLYVAVPPAFLALWSLKARGGYVEILVLGQLLILLAMGAGRRGSVRLWEGALLGFFAGLGVWTNPLIGVYLAPVGIYLLLTLRRRLIGRWLLPAALGVLAGAYPLIQYNLDNGFATAEAMFGGSWSVAEIPAYLRQVGRVSLPILAGLAQASSSERLFWGAFQSGPAGRWEPAVAVSALFLLLAAYGARRIPGLTLGRIRGVGGEALLALLLAIVPVLFAVSKFRELVTEPRYLLPLYSAAPLIALAILSARRLWWWSAPLLVGLALALNVYSLTALNPTLNLPDTAVGSLASNRAELADFLLSRGLDRVYTDYWIGYPLAFESQERVMPSVISGGFNRYIPYAHAVLLSPNPAFVFVEGSTEEEGYLARWKERGVEAKREKVSIYSVYWDARPLERARP